MNTNIMWHRKQSSSSVLDMVLLLADGKTTIDAADLPVQIQMLKALGPRVAAIGVSTGFPYIYSQI